MKNLSIGLKIFFWKGGEFLENWPGAYARRSAGLELTTIDFRYFKLNFAGWKRDIPSGIER